jgi:deazaflavin-dependent oxidoreductase (nitroreductase family)
VSRAYQRLIRRLGHKRWFAALAVRFGSRFERAMYRLTRGRLSPTSSVAPTMLLTTIGRRTGQERTTPLIYVRDREGFVISSEEFGQTHRRAAWPRNLDADPAARVQIGAEVFACRARRLSDEEAARHWPRLVEAWPAHETYLERSGARHTFLLVPESRNAGTAATVGRREASSAQTREPALPP